MFPSLIALLPLLLLEHCVLPSGPDLVLALTACLCPPQHQLQLASLFRPDLVICSSDL